MAHMDVEVQGAGPEAPFLGARDLFETERTVERPVTVTIVEDPDERTRVGHTDDGHWLTISRQAATSARKIASSVDWVCEGWPCS